MSYDVSCLERAREALGPEAQLQVHKSVVYFAYVLALFGGTYGFTLFRAVFLQVDTETLEYLWQPYIALPATATLTLGAAWLCTVLGRSLGPVLPGRAWIDWIVSSHIDRKLSLRQYWRRSLWGTMSIGIVSGAVVGMSAYAVDLAGVFTVVTITLIATISSWICGRSWLAGQAAISPLKLFSPSFGTEALRQLSLATLSKHSARADLLYGSAIIGNIRVMQVEVMSPPTRLRTKPLRASGPLSTIVRRDLLGYERSPIAAIQGALLMVIGSLATAWGLLGSSNSSFAALLGALLIYLAFGKGAEGLRMHASNAGSPTLLGTDVRWGALAHLVAPACLCLAIGLPTSMFATILLPHPSNAALGLSVAGIFSWVSWYVLGFAGLHLSAAFRGSAPLSAYMPGSGPITMVLWYLAQILTGVLTGWILTVRIAEFGMVSSLGLTAVFFLFGVYFWAYVRVVAESAEHRL